jgi:hypothetical protein
MKPKMTQDPLFLTGAVYMARTLPINALYKPLFAPQIRNAASRRHTA